MTGFGMGKDSVPKEIILEQFTGLAFGYFFVSFGIPKMIVVDADELFSGTLNKIFQETLLIQVPAVTRGNHKLIINKIFHCYLNKPQKWF